MIVIKGKGTFFDVDQTLVLFGIEDHPEAIEIEANGVKRKVVIHKKHIEKMKDHAFRGHPVIVWSAGGIEWAEWVVKYLGLENIVTLVIEKPAWFYDDLDAAQFMPEQNRIYYESYQGRNKGHG
jgi:hypothetical protein